MFNLFKKKKPEISEDIIAQFGPPTIITEAKIKPTTCHVCGTIYQANKHQLRCGQIAVFPIRNITICPLCGAENSVTFIKPTEETKT